MQNLDVAPLEHHVEAQLPRQPLRHVQRPLLRLSQRQHRPVRRCKLLLCSLDEADVVHGGHAAVHLAEDGHLEPRLATRRGFALTAPHQRLCELRREPGVVRLHRAEHRRGGHHLALAAAHCPFKAQQADDIRRVGMKWLRRLGGVDPRPRVGRIATQVIHVAQQVALGILRNSVDAAEVEHDRPVRHRTLRQRVAVNRQPPDQRDARPLDQPLRL
mmetsp:Transcript_13868/g.43495  ORF Transcript_13868/g.43495 Transcript_13868/m.43495 type:complete len:216 (-) Transcript_13868:202-849(-)